MAPAMPLRNALRVRIRRGVTPRRRRSITSFPVSNATSDLRGSTAGTSLYPIGEMPISSKVVAIVFAVNCPPQAPGPGQALFSMPSNSSREIRPALRAPTASKTSCTVSRRPRYSPYMIEPP
jgi:hypothetical protein